jgi:hypothetical protein
MIIVHTKVMTFEYTGKIEMEFDGEHICISARTVRYYDLDVLDTGYNSFVFDKFHPSSITKIEGQRDDEKR